jgi:hypothetical protein
MAVRVVAVDRAELAAFPMPDRFRHEISYFMTIPEQQTLPPGEYLISLDHAGRWLEEGVFYLLSPLDGQHQTEIELTEEQEDWLRWIVANQVQRVRVE